MVRSFSLNSDGLFDYLPLEQIRAAFDKSPGNEIGSGKLTSPESSAALAANAFGLFLDQPAVLPRLLDDDSVDWHPTSVTIEETAPFPWWPKGRHPWLDAFVETDTQIIGIESKRYEPFRSHKAAKFSDAYWRPVWGPNMRAFERVRDLLHSGDSGFKRLDAAQLVKHAFGLRTEGGRRNKRPVLVYLYAEPTAWADGRSVSGASHSQHVDETASFAEMVSGDEVEFAYLSYQQLLKSWEAVGAEQVVQHARNFVATFSEPNRKRS